MRNSLAHIFSNSPRIHESLRVNQDAATTGHTESPGSRKQSLILTLPLTSHLSLTDKTLSLSGSLCLRTHEKPNTLVAHNKEQNEKRDFPGPLKRMVAFSQTGNYKVTHEHSALILAHEH